MSNSQNKKNEQQNNLCITSLTEQWKKGELESGWYYVNFYSVGAVMQEYLPEHNGFGYDEKNLIQEVLAPVPSYEEWQPFTNSYFEGLSTKDIAELAKKSIRLTTQHCKDNEEISILREQLKVEICMVDNLINENQQLKELLKECKHIIEWYKADYKGVDVLNEDVITKIDNALGEKK